jgi:hypothetical protein
VARIDCTTGRVDNAIECSCFEGCDLVLEVADLVIPPLYSTMLAFECSLALFQH